jgi:hypothetical protein
MSYPPEPPPTGPGSDPAYGPGPGPAYGPSYGYGYGYGQGPYGPPRPRTNPLAVTALATGVGSLLFSWCCFLGLGGVVAIVLGVRARAEIRSSPGQEGQAFATAGIVTGAIAVALSLVIVVLLVITFAGAGSYEISTTRGVEL